MIKIEACLFGSNHLGLVALFAGSSFSCRLPRSTIADLLDASSTLFGLHRPPLAVIFQIFTKLCIKPLSRPSPLSAVQDQAV